MLRLREKSNWQLLKNKIQPNKLEDQNGFIKQFMNWTASYVANRSCTPICAQKTGTK